MLKYYITLQPVFKEAMGPIRDSDLCAYKVFPDNNDYTYHYGWEYKNGRIAVRLPLPIDPVNPERGLWGMVDWKRLRPCINSYGNMGMYEKDKKGSVYPQARWNYPPTLALLKTLAAQHLPFKPEELNTKKRICR